MLALQTRAPIIGLAAVLGFTGSIWQATRLAADLRQIWTKVILPCMLRILVRHRSGQAIVPAGNTGRHIKALPEVEQVFAKIRTADVATDAVPPSVADNSYYSETT